MYAFSIPQNILNTTHKYLLISPFQLTDFLKCCSHLTRNGYFVMPWPCLSLSLTWTACPPSVHWTCTEDVRTISQTPRRQSPRSDGLGTSSWRLASYTGSFNRQCLICQELGVRRWESSVSSFPQRRGNWIKGIEFWGISHLGQRKKIKVIF